MEDIEDASVTVESGSSVLNALNVYADEADLEIENGQRLRKSIRYRHRRHIGKAILPAGYMKSTTKWSWSPLMPVY